VGKRFGKARSVARAGGPVGSSSDAPSPWRDAPGVTRIDAHVHSNASNGPAVAALGFIGCPECYSEPEGVYDMARARGMDLVTITDHDTIKGALTLAERGFEGFIVGQEATVFFPEDKCKLHVLIWGLTPDQDEHLQSSGMKRDVYAFAHWLREQNLAHAVAHPLYVQNRRLTRWHIERCALLFKGFESLNGAHSKLQSTGLDPFLDTLTPAKIVHLQKVHGIEAVWPRAWQKARTGGSDDHAMLNIGRTWTELRLESGEKVADPREFFKHVMGGRTVSNGAGGHSSLLAHQLTSVGMHYFAERILPSRSTRTRFLGSRLMRFAGVDAPSPSKLRMAASHVKDRAMGRKRTNPTTRALKECFGPALDAFPDLRHKLERDAWKRGTQDSALSDHERMAAFADELLSAMHGSMGRSLARSIRRRDRREIMEHLSGYVAMQVAQIPYVFSLFHQNKERPFLERFVHDTSEPGSGHSPLERPMRVSLFTDTLGDINGVSRFIQNVAQRAHETGRDLQVITSTRMTVPDAPNIYNFKPIFTGTMPGYSTLEAVLPPILPILRHIDQHQPDAIHISTPGAVGMVGYLAAKMLRVPVLGVYHTDFPAYIDHLFDDEAFTFACSRFMRFFYAPFRAIFTRSDDYVQSLERLGIERGRVLHLKPGIEVQKFHTRFADRESWRTYGLDPKRAKVLYIGRVSVEKNLPLLSSVWKQTSKRLREHGLEADLIVVGDGPFRPQMERELKGCNASFLGFRHGDELSRLYASSDLFVFPSTTDTLGQVVMESQASGLPVLVSDQGGPKEVVREGETGFVLSASDPNAWVEKIVALVADDERRARMGAAAHASMQEMSLESSFEHFWDVHVDAWHAHLAERGITPREPVQRRESRTEIERDTAGV
jgi:glycosyltransferase involved in cell wall biosynthesis